MPIRPYTKLGRKTFEDDAGKLKTFLGDLADAGTTSSGFIWLSAQGGLSPTSNGAERDKIQLATNGIVVVTYAFDQTTQEYLQWNIATPDDWDGGTVTATFYWIPAAGSAAENVVWGLQGRAYASNDAIDQAMGTAQEVTSGFTAADDLIISSETSAITLAGSPSAGQWLMLQAYRDPTNGSDDMTGDARLIGVLVEYSRS
jgi:hypothetical protein